MSEFELKGESYSETGFSLAHYTTAERLLFVPQRVATLVYDTDLDQAFVWDSTNTWEPVPTESFLSNNFVTVNTNQLVGGVKTFSDNTKFKGIVSTDSISTDVESFILSAAPVRMETSAINSIVDDNDLINKGYVDTEIAANISPPFNGGTITNDLKIENTSPKLIIDSSSSNPAMFFQRVGDLKASIEDVGNSLLIRHQHTTSTDHTNIFLLDDSISVNKPVFGIPTTSQNNDQTLTTKGYVDSLVVDSTDFVTLNDPQTILSVKTFSTANWPIMSSNTDPTNDRHLATKGYVDDQSVNTSNFIDRSTSQTIGGNKTFTILPQMSSSTVTPTVDAQLTTKGYVDGEFEKSVNLSTSQTIGGNKTFTVLPRMSSSTVTPNEDAQLTTKGYVDGEFAKSVNLSTSQTIGGNKTFTVLPRMSSSTVTPNVATQLTTKGYVDGEFAKSVNLSTSQTIGGQKTFSILPLMTTSTSTPNNPRQLITKGYVDDLGDNYVQTSGTQSVNGQKTFSILPLTSSTSAPNNDNQLITKGYVDDLGDNYVQTSGTQSVNGQKTFSILPLMSTSTSAPNNSRQLITKGYVDDLGDNYVQTSGTQSVNGQKTFSILPLTSSTSAPNNDNQLITKGYVDTTASNLVTIGTTQTITGLKTFNNIPRITSVNTLPTNPNDLVHLEYMEDNTVNLTGPQAIGGNKTFDDNVIVSGNLTVQGTTTSINSTEVNIGDNVIVLNSDATGTPTENGGIEIERGSQVNTSLFWKESTDDWRVSVGSTFEEAIVLDNDPRLTNSRAPTAHVHDAADITTGTFANVRISASSVTQHLGDYLDKTDTSPQTIVGIVNVEDINVDNLEAENINVNGRISTNTGLTLDIDTSPIIADILFNSDSINSSGNIIMRRNNNEVSGIRLQDDLIQLTASEINIPNDGGVSKITIDGGTGNTRTDVGNNGSVSFFSHGSNSDILLNDTQVNVRLDGSVHTSVGTFNTTNKLSIRNQPVAAGTSATAELELFSYTGTNTFQTRVASSPVMTESYTMIMPPNRPTAGQVMRVASTSGQTITMEWYTP